MRYGVRKSVIGTDREFTWAVVDHQDDAEIEFSKSRKRARERAALFNAAEAINEEAMRT